MTDIENKVVPLLNAIQKGASVVYHTGIHVDTCNAVVRDTVKRLRDEGKITFVQKRIAPPTVGLGQTGRVDWYAGIGLFDYIAQGL